METDEDLIICDLAETYHVLDYKSLPPTLVATLVAGLRDDSRLKLKAAKVKAPLNTILLASIIDRISGDEKMKLTNSLFEKEEYHFNYKSIKDFKEVWKSLGGG